MSLAKQIEENPGSLRGVFAVGSKHQATVVKWKAARTRIALRFGRYLLQQPNKQEGGALGVDDQVDFVVLEFNRNAKRITVSTCAPTKKGSEV